MKLTTMEFCLLYLFAKANYPDEMISVDGDMSRGLQLAREFLGLEDLAVTARPSESSREAPLPDLALCDILKGVKG